MQLSTIKKLFFIAPAISIALQLCSVDLVNASETEISDTDFIQLVCSNLYQAKNKSAAIDKIMALTDSQINNSQLATLKKIAQSDRLAKDFCRASLPRF